MNINNDVDQLKVSIDKTDGLSAKNILKFLEMKSHSVWFTNEMPTVMDKKTDLSEPEEDLLTFEKVKELYPHWFKL